MTREEADQIIDETEGMFGMMTGFHPYRAVHIIRLARLGASVAAPTEEEIEAMAKAMVVGPHPDELIPMSDGTKMVRRPAWTAKKWSVERVLEELLALKDRANV